MCFEIVFYDVEDKEPVKDFILGTDKKMQAKILRSLELLEKNGTGLREPYSKHLEDGIYELRVQTGNNQTRILYFFMSMRRIVLTNGFVKKTQKTPINELKKAKRFKQEYLRRQENRNDRF